MPETRLLVLRHFATKLNAGEGGAEKSRSWSHIGIDRKTAEPLADKAARVFDKHGVTSVTGSDLPRNTESMQLVASKMKEKPQIQGRREARTWNTGEAGKPEKEAREERKKFVRHPDEPMPGGESFNAFRNRTRPFLEGELAKQKANPGRQRAVVLHGHQAMDSENVLNDEPMKDEHWARLDEIKPGHMVWLVDDGKRARLEKLEGGK